MIYYRAMVLLSDFSRVVLDLRPGLESDTLNGFWKELVAKEPDADPMRYFVVNQELLAFYRDLLPGTPIHLYTDGKLHTLPPIAEAIAGIFTREFKGDASLPKNAPESYRKIAEALGMSPENIVFVDDKPTAIEAARFAGCVTVLHTDTALTIAVLKDLLPS